MPKASAQEIKYGEDNPIESAPELTEEDKHGMQQRIAALDKILTQEQRAKYRIELFFGKARSNKYPIPGCLSFWESGSMLHGGGDAKVYFCPSKQLKRGTCEAIIPFAMNAYGFLVCPSCQTTWQGGDVIGEVLGRHSMNDWARLVFMYYTRLGLNSDISLKYAPDDIRYAAHLEQERDRGGEKLAKSRAARIPNVYPLRNIIKDTAAGADLLKRFYAFLTA